MRATRTLLVGAVVALGACGAASRQPARSAVVVVTDDWALGRVVDAVGAGSVRVVDPPPAPLPADALAVTSPRSSASFAAAASASAHHVAFSGDALVPDDTASFAAVVTSTLTAMAPGMASTWRGGLAAVQTQARSTTGDVETSLQSCPRRTLAADSHALDGFLRIGAVSATVVTPTDVRRADTVFGTGAPDDGALRSAGARLVDLPVLVTAPPGAPASLGYAGGLEDLLAAITKGLGCPLEQ